MSEQQDGRAVVEAVRRIESGVVPGKMGYFVPKADWDALVSLAAAPPAPDAGVFLCRKCGHGSVEHGTEGHPAYQCAAEMALVPSPADAVRERGLVEALEEIADLTPAPDDHEWYDEYRDRADYPVYITGAGGRGVRMEGVDDSNRGDVESFGMERGMWKAAKIARRALVNFKLHTETVR